MLGFTGCQKGSVGKMKEKTLYKSTTISPERTKADIDKMLKDFGISNRAWITKDGDDILLFEWVLDLNGVQKKLNFELRPPEIRQQKRVWNQKTSRTEKLNVRNDAVAYRLLYNYVKNKLEAVRVGMVTVENEFMSHITFSLRNGSSTTMGQELASLMFSGKIQNALDYRSIAQEPDSDVIVAAPRNITKQLQDEIKSYEERKQHCS